jgi:L-ascorbate metabolism protein UlaG (beta-lactamase superfamily)
MRVVWWGHSTATIEDDGVRVLTDPILVDRLAHLRRRGGPSPGADARRADVVVLSHLHADHLHVPSLRQLPAGVRLLAPRGARALLDAARGDLGDRCEEMMPGDETTVGSLHIRAVPAEHDGRRHPFSRHGGPALGFVVSGGQRAYFAGDTDLHDAMFDLGELDLALIPVGGWGPTLGAGHLDPERAAEATRRCGPTVAVPIHWGTLWPIGLGRVRTEHFAGPGPRFARAVERTFGGTRVRVLEPGQTLDLAEA